MIWDKPLLNIIQLVGCLIIRLSMMEQLFRQVKMQDVQKQNKAECKPSFFKTTLTNIAYKIKNNCLIEIPFLSRIPIVFHSESAKAYLFGQLYDKNTEKDFIKDFEKIIWFSYRKVNSQFEDVGWGCMIRVIQMMIAKTVSKDQPELQVDDLINFFRQSKEGPLSLSKICFYGNINCRWSSSPQILMIVSSILNDLKLQRKINFKFQIFCEKVEIKAYESYKPEDFPKLITIHTKIGEEKTINESYLFNLLSLLKDKRFVGMVTGMDTEALYIIGSFERSAIILDPHYVQEEQLLQTFFPKNPQGIKFTELSNGVSLNFYIESFSQFETFVSQLLYINRISMPFVCFGTEIDQSWNQGRRKGSDDFQIL